MSEAASDSSLHYLKNEYSGPLVALYEMLHEDDEDEAFWLASAARLAGSGRVLEMGCGSGRLLIPLARAGSTLTGVDGSRDMLDALNAKLAGEAPDVAERVELICSHFDTIDAPHAFDLIFFSCDTFQHLVGTEVQLKALERVKALLAPGGRLVIDMTVLDLEIALAGADQEQIHDYPGDQGERWRLKVTTKLDLRGMRETDLIEIERVEEEEGGAGRIAERFRSRSEMALIFPRELELLLRCAEFKVEQRLGSYAGDAYDGDQPQFIVVASASA